MIITDMWFDYYGGDEKISKWRVSSSFGDLKIIPDFFWTHLLVGEQSFFIKFSSIAWVRGEKIFEATEINPKGMGIDQFLSLPIQLTGSSGPDPKLFSSKSRE
ncbi:hypothetical protein JGUZn3_22090 [Entomobacter blattae]|uniref:Uncharacterized protein n=1 Tax=Entomobacter blattae TaxID=2762277 RepID=A0A7H1NUF0_9PROT|nr:hypothetical protein JGUZn3_22090 [Entomobacter blattae]